MLNAGFATTASSRAQNTIDIDDTGELLNYLKNSQIPVRDLRAIGTARKFRHRRAHIELGRCRLIRASTSAFEARTDEGGRIFAFCSTRGSRSMESGSTRVTSQIGHPAIIVPYQEARFHTTGNCGFIATLPIQEVANDLGLAAIGEQWVQRSALAGELSKPSAAQFLHSFHFVWQQISILPKVPPLLLAAYDEIILNCLSALLRPLFPETAAQPVHDPGSRLIDLACDILRSEAEQPLKITSVAARLGVTPRHLQKGFRRYLATTPQQFLNEHRLGMARQRLLTARDGENVTSIAFDCDFGHLGEFSARYGGKFNERPSETLAKRSSIFLTGSAAPPGSRACRNP